MPRILLVLLLVLAACSTARKRARELLEQGHYEQAVKSYETLLASNPGDAEVAAGLTQAKHGVLGQKLIEVRKLRQSGSPGAALELLLQTLELQARWKLAPPGAAAFTQDEERRELLPH